MAALDDLPGLVLGLALLWRLGVVPADRRRIEKDLRATQRSQPRTFGKPLVPTHQDADPGVTRLKRLKPQIARGEVELLVIERVIGDMHLTVFTQEGTVGVDHHRGVVEQALSTLLEQRSDYHDLVLSREVAQYLGGGAR